MTNRAETEMVERLRAAVQGVKINGQRMRLSDEYADEIARAVLGVIYEPMEAHMARHLATIAAEEEEK